MEYHNYPPIWVVEGEAEIETSQAPTQQNQLQLPFGLQDQDVGALEKVVAAHPELQESAQNLMQGPLARSTMANYVSE